jgi:serine/threonine protein kinase
MNRDAEIFAEAIELPEAERAAFLARACGGDAALRSRVEQLLAGYDAAGLFMESSPVARAAEELDEPVGARLGHYSIVRKLGEGGCGIVYLAEQHAPVRRLVALKVIKLGMDTRDVIARFEAERQALALMDHPGIARVFDAGATETGRPYFVMEYVDGQPIVRFCDGHSLDLRARLELFARVCAALQHAHQKGVIHRDIKPGNILVSLHDGVPQPKIIDFGIAKATQGRLTEHTVVTSLGQLIGTPAYMSPEQAAAAEDDIDTRSDIYSLGVLLYELLTGRPPYDPKSLVRAGIEEIRRIIREVDPPRPSHSLATLDHAGLTTLARQRRAAPTQLTSALRRDLDWIVMRCLEKNRERRYGTAAALADDIQRHLRSEPIVARPPHAAYLARKFVVRHRYACATALALSTALVTGTVVSLRQAARAERAETLAVRQREQAEALLAFMLGDYRTELKKIGKLDLLDSIGAQAMAYFSALDPLGLSDTALARQAKALTQIGETRLDQARYPEAAEAFAVAYARASALVDRHPRDADMLFERAQVEFWRGALARRRGDLTDAALWLARYRDSAAALLALEGGTLRAQQEFTSGLHNLAVVDLDLGRLDAARAGLVAERRAIEEMLARHPPTSALRFRLSDVESWLGTVEEQAGNFAAMRDRFAAAAERVAALAAAEPAVARWQLRLAEARVHQANAEQLVGHLELAGTLRAEARQRLETLVAQDPRNRQWLVALLRLRLHAAAAQLVRRDPTIAAQLGPLRAQLEALVAEEPTALEFHRQLANSWRLEGIARRLAGRPDAAEAAARAVEIGERLVRENRADRPTRGELAQARLAAGRIAAAAGDATAAAAHFEAAIAAVRPRLAGTTDWRVLDPVAQALALLGRPTEAAPHLAQLRRLGYRSIDPFAGPLLDLASTQESSAPNR